MVQDSIRGIWWNSNTAVSSLWVGVPRIIMSLSDLGFGDHFTTDVFNSIFLIASVLLFIVVLLAINQLRRRFSATTCLELGVVLFLFTVAADSQIRSIIFQYLLEPIFNSLLTPLKKLLELLLGRGF